MISVRVHCLDAVWSRGNNWMDAPVPGSPFNLLAIRIDDICCIFFYTKHSENVLFSVLKAQLYCRLCQKDYLSRATEDSVLSKSSLISPRKCDSDVWLFFIIILCFFVVVKCARIMLRQIDCVEIISDAMIVVYKARVVDPLRIIALLPLWIGFIFQYCDIWDLQNQSN